MNRDLDTLAHSQPALARALSDGWRTPIAEWSRAQWTPPSEPGFEPAMRRALAAELTERPGGDGDAEALVAAVERVGGVLTPHHVCPTDGPTFGAIDRIACAGQPGPVLVLAWSGLPMSNTAASGALCFGHGDYGALLREGTPELKRQRAAAKDRARDGVTESRVVLVPPELRDALVYGCPMPARVAEVIDAATPALRAFLPDPAPGEAYPAWSLRVCERIERRLVGRDDLFYVDLNRVAARYLVEVLADDAHPVTRLLTGPGRPTLDDLSWFYERRPGKRESVATHYAPPEADLPARIASGALCPGLVPVFGALRTRSRITLLGGYRQVQYLEQIASAWAAAGFADPVSDPGVPGRLITGRLRGQDGRNIYPLDVALGVVDDGALPSGTDPMSVVWEPILARLIANA